MVETVTWATATARSTRLPVLKNMEVYPLEEFKVVLIFVFHFLKDAQSKRKISTALNHLVKISSF